VTDTQEPTQVTSGTGSQPVGTRRKSGSLASMLLPELQQLAASLGINTTKMRKSDLVAAIQNRQTSVASADGHATDSAAVAAQQLPMDGAALAVGPPAEATGPSVPETPPAAVDGAPDQGTSVQERPGRANGQAGGRGPQTGGQPSSGQPAGGTGQQSGEREDEGDGGRRRGRRYRDRRGRNRDRSGQPSSGTPDAEPTVSEDDVLIPVAGILDALEEKNTWFVRTAGYFASPEDIYVANSYVRRFGLRRGDAVTGAIRQPRDGERREKYNPLVRLDTVNGRDPEAAKNRVEFTKLTPLYPQSRLRLETEPHLSECHTSPNHGSTTGER